MYIRKAKNDDDFNEEGDEKHETYSKPNYWVPENAKTQEVETDYYKTCNMG